MLFRKVKVLVGAGIGQFRRSISFDRLQNSSTKPWRDSGSAIIVAPMNNNPPYSLGYLMIERSKGSGVAPGCVVFPGGVVSPVDFSPRWTNLYRDANIDLGSFQFFDKNAHTPEIYSREGTDAFPYPSSVVFRLAAIRETFEEVGILICRKTDRASNLCDYDYDYEQLSDRKVVQAWQTKIRKSPEEFINLCVELKCVPDLNALSDWSEWLTPTSLKPKARFDTIFYMLILPKMPRVAYDTHEVASAQWASSASLLKDHLEGKIKLMPPQLYELSRMLNLKSIPEFEERVLRRQKLGIERFFPIVEQALDGILFLLPGDDRYSKEPDVLTFSKPQKLDQTFEQLQSSGQKFHRAQLTKDGAYTTVINVERFGHAY
ncbi:nucleoside diphosphate-linked moiety X motif 19 [Folsomia candida]|uniref:Nucleoside diphosphate-linked moiety X motif 19, mitochondrial n=1 Tax=Folsomia candida TaxID=158441 RepID=A0A226F1D1_FOLCA|nr:nucleoside diphosphate-linked moiety X motif 19 [Folsomia candida]OXA63572.1 Nucleoside diphosphate-linked moiety X motif 19, mitochondrial [Folsomia candida]